MHSDHGKCLHDNFVIMSAIIKEATAACLWHVIDDMDEALMVFLPATMYIWNVNGVLCPMQLFNRLYLAIDQIEWIKQSHALRICH